MNGYTPQRVDACVTASSGIELRINQSNKAIVYIKLTLNSLPPANAVLSVSLLVKLK